MSESLRISGKGGSFLEKDPTFFVLLQQRMIRPSLASRRGIVRPRAACLEML